MSYIISGNCSAILGGNGNNDGGFDQVFIAGAGITGVMNNALHVNEIVMSHIPDGSVSYSILPVGALYYLAVGSGVGSQTVYVK